MNPSPHVFFWPPVVFFILMLALPFYRTCVTVPDVLPVLGIIWCLFNQMVSLYISGNMAEVRHPKTLFWSRCLKTFALIMIIEPLFMVLFMVLVEFEKMPTFPDQVKLCLLDPTWVGEHSWWFLAGWYLYLVECQQHAFLPSTTSKETVSKQTKYTGLGDHRVEANYSIGDNEEVDIDSAGEPEDTLVAKTSIQTPANPPKPKSKTKKTPIPDEENGHTY